MMTADEARKIASDQDRTIRQQFEKIERCIYEYSLNGLFSVNIAGHIHPYVQDYYERMGYGVAVFDDCYTIDWAR